MVSLFLTGPRLWRRLDPSGRNRSGTIPSRAHPSRSSIGLHPHLDRAILFRDGQPGHRAAGSGGGGVQRRALGGGPGRGGAPPLPAARRRVAGGRRGLLPRAVPAHLPDRGGQGVGADGGGGGTDPGSADRGRAGDYATRPGRPAPGRAGAGGRAPTAGPGRGPRGGGDDRTGRAAFGPRPSGVRALGRGIGAVDRAGGRSGRDRPAAADQTDAGLGHDHPRDQHRAQTPEPGERRTAGRAHPPGNLHHPHPLGRGGRQPRGGGQRPPSPTRWPPSPGAGFGTRPPKACALPCPPARRGNCPKAPSPAPTFSNVCTTRSWAPTGCP